MDLTGYLRRIMNASAAETFDPSTDSLEAIRDFIAAMMGFGPGVSLWMFGRCAVGMAASTTVITTDNLGAALPNDVFNGEFYIAVIHNADAPGTAPEGEWRRVSDFVGATQTFTTDAFTVNVEENDLLLIVHESILFGQPLARGTLDASSATVPADSTRTEGDNYFRGHLFMTTEGATRFQPRLIVEYTGVGGIFTLDPNNPLTAAPGLVDYVILPYQSQFVPAADAAINRTPSDVIGNKADAATLDDMSALATASLVAEAKRILLRMSPDAFTATIQGGARTELDTMLAQLATYFVAAGAAMSIQINGNAARTNLQQVWQDFSAVFGADGANVFNPTIQGAARTDLDTALNILATYLTAAGAAMSIQVNGNVARTNLEQAFEDLTAVFGADGANIFNPTIQGAGQTDLDAALAQLAIYFAAAGAAMSVQVNGGVARANLELILEDYFAVVGCDGANIFNPTIQGAARTTIEAAFDGLAAYFVAAGGALSVTIDPGGVARTTLATLWNDLGQMLAGASGITTWPASSPPGNGVSIAEAIRQIYDDIVTVNSGFQEQADTAVNITAILASETDVFDLSVAATRYIVRSLRLKCVDPGANTVTVRLYELVNDVSTVVATFTIDTTNFTNYFDLMSLFGTPHLSGDNLRVTVQASAGGPYAVTGQYSHATAT